MITPIAKETASFPFPSNFKNDDSLRVQNIIFDAFSKFENPENYQLMALKNVDSNAEKILSERGLYNCTTGTGLITTNIIQAGMNGQIPSIMI